MFFLKVEVKGAIHRAFGDFDVQRNRVKGRCILKAQSGNGKVHAGLFARRKRNTLRIDGKRLAVEIEPQVRRDRDIDIVLEIRNEG